MKFGMSTWGMRGMLYIIYFAFAVFFLHVYLFLFGHKHWANWDENMTFEVGVGTIIFVSIYHDVRYSLLFLLL